jgi:hypothetical protein
MIGVLAMPPSGVWVAVVVYAILGTILWWRNR